MTNHPFVKAAYAGITALLFALATYYFVAQAVRSNELRPRETLLYGLAAAGTLSLLLRRGGSFVRLVREHRPDVQA